MTNSNITLAPQIIKIKLNILDTFNYETVFVNPVTSAVKRSAMKKVKIDYDS